MKQSKESGLKRLATYIKEYRISVVPGKSWLGVLHVLLGSAIFGLTATIHHDIRDPAVLEFSFMIMYLSGAIALFLYILFASLFSGNLKQGFKTLFIIGNTDIESYHARTHLTVKQRRLSIYARGILATGAYCALNIAGIFFKPIDNTQIFGADALFFTILSIWWLREKFRWGTGIGIFLALSGVAVVLFNDLASFDRSDALSSAGAALFSAISFSIIFVMTSIIIRHDTPLRVAFHQCIAGVGLTIGALLITLLGIFIFKYKFSFPVISVKAAGNSVLLGVSYAIAIVQYFRAFLFTRPVIIAALTCSIPFFTVFFELLLGNATFNTINYIPTALIMIGCGWLIWEDNKDDKKKAQENTIEAAKPVYSVEPNQNSLATDDSFLITKYGKSLKYIFSSVKERYDSKLLNIYEYISERHEFNKILLEYSKEIGRSDVEAIEILPEAVIFTFAPLHIKLETDGAARSAPFEVLNFGHYEPEDASLAYGLIQNGDTIIDIGANIGWYAVNFAKRFPVSQIYAFEPVPATYAVLLRNIKMNKIENTTALNFGISNSEEDRFLYYFKGGSAIASIENLIDHKNAEKVLCKMKTLDMFVVESKLKTVDFVKCDVEGSELFVLQGAKKVLADLKPLFFIEICEEWCRKCGYQSFDIISLFNQYGYCCFEAINGKLHKMEGIRSKDEGRYNYFFLHKVKHAALIHKFS